jgi:hypothetical protein
MSKLSEHANIHIHFSQFLVNFTPSKNVVNLDGSVTKVSPKYAEYTRTHRARKS